MGVGGGGGGRGGGRGGVEELFQVFSCIETKRVNKKKYTKRESDFEMNKR